ncbi:MAG: copper chaperone PCu(A)C [Steroidobacteraceae bacterium]
MLSTPRFSLASTLTGAVLAALAASALIPAVAAGPAGAPTGAPSPERPVVAGPNANPSEALQIEQAWIRWLPANLPAGGYLTVTNRGERPVVLVSASSPDYAGVALHRSVTEGGLSKMEPVAQITVAPHATLSFSATGYHIMLTTPTLPVAPGGHVPIALHFADGRSLVVNFEVRAPSATAPAMPGMPDMPAKPH